MLVSSTIARADARRRSPQFETHRSFGDDEQSAAVMIRSISYYSRVRRGKKYVARYDIEAVGDGEHNSFLARIISRAGGMETIAMTDFYYRYGFAPPAGCSPHLCPPPRLL